jgi:hypothetical protein
MLGICGLDIEVSNSTDINTLHMRHPVLEFTLLGEGSWNCTNTIARHSTKARDIDGNQGDGDDSA